MNAALARRASLFRCCFLDRDWFFPDFCDIPTTLAIDPEPEAPWAGMLWRTVLLPRGWSLSDDGQLSPMGDIDLSTGGRAALEEQLERLRKNTDDPAALLGTAKDLLEAAAKFVLEGVGFPLSGKEDFNNLWYLSRERLNLLPQNVDPNIPGHKAIQAVLGSAWKIADQVNVLRNLQGTGHGHTLPTGVSGELALLVVREACSVADFMLSTLDRQLGRRAE